MEMKSAEVSTHFAFCSYVSLCGTNREQIFRLLKTSWTIVSLLMPSQSQRQPPILCQYLSHFLDHLWGSACRWRSRTWIVLSRFLPFAKALGPFLNTFSAHGFPPVHPHQHFTRLRCSFPQIIAELDVCTLLHCAVTLSLTLTTFNWPQLVYTAGHMQYMLCCVSILLMPLKNHAHARRLAPSCLSDMTPFTELFRQTLYCI